MVLMATIGLGIGLGLRPPTLTVTPPEPILLPEVVAFVDTIPAFNPNWKLADGAFTGFSWADGAIQLPYSGKPTPLKDSYVGMHPDKAGLQLFGFGSWDISQHYTRVLEFDVLSAIPDGQEIEIIEVGGGTLSNALDLVGFNGEQRIRNNLLYANTKGHVLPAGTTEFRWPTSWNHKTGFYYESSIDGSLSTNIVPLADTGVQSYYLAFDMGNPYIRLASGAQWDWAYHDGNFSIDLATDWLNQAKDFNSSPTISDLTAPPRFVGDVDQNSVFENNVFQTGVFE